MRKQFIIWTVIVIILQVADVLLTRKGLSLGYGEGNPIGVWAMHKFGVMRGMIYLKLTVIPWLALLYYRGDVRTLKVLAWIMVFVAIIPWVLAIYFPIH